MQIHIVQENQTITSIAVQYGVSEARIKYDNQLPEGESLVIGQALIIQIPNTIHIVEAGQDIQAVAAQYGVSELQIYRNNPYLLQDSILREGEYLVISFQNEKIGSMYADGYAYPYISDEVLDESLLYLSYFSIFSYGFTETGELLSIDDERLLESSLGAGVRPMLVLTPFGPDGNFSNLLVNTLMENDEVQTALIENLYVTVTEKDYSGVNVDFEYILAEDRERYVEFIRRLRERLSPEGYLVSVCLAPKTSVDQPGLLYEGIDYQGLGEAADYVLCMTYEWGYTYGPAMAVSPINKVLEVLDFAVSQIPSEKILMGISNYGYDWTLPYIRGESMARTIGNVEAIQIARENNAVIQFDEVAQAPYFNYTVDDQEHEVWFEDARSINARLRLVAEYGLKGAAYWQLMKLFRANFIVLYDLYDIKR